MTTALESFLDELRADRELAPCAADLADALQQIDFEGDSNREAAAFYEALILHHQTIRVGKGAYTRS
jgi:hypothetical protein